MGRLSHYVGSAVQRLYDALRAERRVVKLAVLDLVLVCGNLPYFCRCGNWPVQVIIHCR